MMEYLLLFIFWTIFWSFGSVLLWRLQGDINKNTIKWILFGQSKCTSCWHVLWVKDLFPIFSWLFNRWNCRYCSSKISLLYPMIELLSWFTFCLSYFLCIRYLWYNDIFDPNFILNFIFICFFNWVLVLFLLSDILFFSLNVWLWLLSLIIILLLQFIWLVWDFYIAFIWALSFFLVFYGIYHFAKFYVRIRFWYKWVEWFGEWDVMMAFWIWLIMPFVLVINSLNSTIYNIVVISFIYLLLSSLIWIIFAWLSRVFYRWKQGKSIPFLPAMIFAFWVILLFGKYLINV